MDGKNHSKGWTDVDSTLAAGVAVGLVLLAPTLRWWVLLAAVLVVVTVAGARWGAVK